MEAFADEPGFADTEWAQEVYNQIRATANYQLPMNCTVFMPGNQAIQKYSKEDPTAIDAMKTRAGVDCVTAHMVGQPLGLHDFKEGVQVLQTLSGLPLTITKTNNGLVSLSNGRRSALIVRADIPLEGDSVGHIIDDVLAPVASLGASVMDLNWAFEAAKQASYDPTSNVCTILAPSDEALARYAQCDPQAALSLCTRCGYNAVASHVIPNVALSLADIPEGTSVYESAGKTPLAISKDRHANVTVAGSNWGNTFPARVLASNIAHGNAIIHVISAVLHPVA